jgi:hypothetical protein
VVRSPTTETGLPVEEQIRKEWDPKRQGGLPTSKARSMSSPIEDYGIIGNLHRRAGSARRLDRLAVPAAL